MQFFVSFKHNFIIKNNKNRQLLKKLINAYKFVNVFIIIQKKITNINPPLYSNYNNLNKKYQQSEKIRGNILISFKIIFSYLFYS